jgi:hypothetical protein
MESIHAPAPWAIQAPAGLQPSPPLATVPAPWARQAPVIFQPSPPQIPTTLQPEPALATIPAPFRQAPVVLQLSSAPESAPPQTWSTEVRVVTNNEASTSDQFSPLESHMNLDPTLLVQPTLPFVQTNTIDCCNVIDPVLAPSSNEASAVISSAQLGGLIPMPDFANQKRSTGFDSSDNSNDSSDSSDVDDDSGDESDNDGTPRRRHAKTPHHTIGQRTPSTLSSQMLSSPLYMQAQKKWKKTRRAPRKPQPNIHGLVSGSMQGTLPYSESNYSVA